MDGFRRIGILAVLVVGGCTSEIAPPESLPPTQAFIPPPPFPYGPQANPSPNELNGKFVAINYLLGDEDAATILASPTVKRLGNRDFLVGDVVAPGGHASGDKKSVSAWVPVDGVESMIVFESKDQALREANDSTGAKM